MLAKKPAQVLGQDVGGGEQTPEGIDAEAGAVRPVEAQAVMALLHLVPRVPPGAAQRAWTCRGTTTG